MRKLFIAGNWKMNMLSAEAAALAAQLAEGLKDVKDIELAVAPPFTALSVVAEALAGSSIQLAAQDMHWEEKGAYTGEVSGPMLRDLDCSHVIIGHSERRQYFGETDESVNKKLKAAFQHGLIPILCVGETLSEREAGKTFEVVERQVRGALSEISERDAESLVMAYEPVWAIGTGKTATPEQAQEVHERIRGLIAELYGKDLAERMRIQYGGSVKPENTRELMSRPDIDGALVGGASLKPESFVAIVNNSR
jgi:triosephosphate isomerase